MSGDAVIHALHLLPDRSIRIAGLERDEGRDRERLGISGTGSSEHAIRSLSGDTEVAERLVGIRGGHLRDHRRAPPRSSRYITTISSAHLTARRRILLLRGHHAVLVERDLDEDAVVEFDHLVHVPYASPKFRTFAARSAAASLGAAFFISLGL